MNMFDEKTGELILDLEEWVETCAYTISPRTKKINHDDLKKRVSAFFNKAAVIFDIHIARTAYSGIEGNGDRAHIHGSIKQRREEHKISLERWRLLASGWDLCLGDNVSQAFKSIHDSDGWDGYTKKGHELVASWVSCPRTKACGYNRKYSGMKACRHRKHSKKR
jgi:hypothetical protein